MNIIERLIYIFLFLFNKYIGFQFFEDLLSGFENRMIKKYIKKEYIPPTPIPTIYAKQLSNQRFLKMSNNLRNPVLIKGFMKDTQAVSNWDFDYFKQILGDYKLNILSKKDRLEIMNMSFSEFNDRAKNEPLYINNNNTILSDYSILFNDVKRQFNKLINTIYTMDLKHIHIANLFMGYTKNGSNMHCGGSGNLFCMIRGTKRWTLIDPRYSALLKGRVSESGIHGQTLFDMPDTSLNDYPNIFNYLPRYDVVLEPGDILWNAPWWWHRVENSDGLNIGLAIRNNKVTKLNLYNNLTYTLSGSTYLLYNSIIIGLYEKYYLKKGDNFTKSNDKGSVLYQIEKLNNKYPKSVTIEEIKC